MKTTNCPVLKDYQADRGLMNGNHLQGCNECQEYFKQQSRPPHCQSCRFQRNNKANALLIAKLSRILTNEGYDGLARYLEQNNSQKPK